MERSPTGADSIRVLSAGRPLILEATATQLKVTSGSGVLDPIAAEVIMALGGTEPAWLRTVEGLQAVFEERGFDESELAKAAEVLGRKPATRANLAKTDSDPVVLLALAAAGQSQVAGNPDCSSRMWDLLGGHRDEQVQRKAREIGVILPPALAGHTDPDVKLRVARNPGCPPETLTLLGQCFDDAVQTAVAANPATPPETLETMRGSWAESVRIALAANVHTPTATLRRLAWSRSAQVRASAAANRSLPGRTSTMLLWDKDGRVRFALAQRDDLGPITLSWLERYARRDKQYRQTRWRLSQNPATPPRLHRRLETIRQAEQNARAQQMSKDPGRRKTARGRVMAGLVGFVVFGFVSVMSAIGCLVSLADSTPSSTAISAVAATIAGWITLRIYRWIRRIERSATATSSLERSRPLTPKEAAAVLGVVTLVAGLSLKMPLALPVLPTLLAWRLLATRRHAKNHPSV